MERSHGQEAPTAIVGRGQHDDALLGNSRREILSALVSALGKVRKLTRADHNEVEGYSFSSIDDFLSLVNPICAETGLLVLIDETAVIDLSGRFPQGSEGWLRICYEISLAHVSGETLGPFRRHVDIARAGPQAFGAAQSYVLKQFLRAQFQIATGEVDDPDFGIGLTKSGQGARRDRSGRKEEHGEAVGRPISLTEFAARIERVASGQELLAILNDVPECFSGDRLLREARLVALRRIVASAQSEAALTKLEQHFASDWRTLGKVAADRKAALKACETAKEAVCAHADHTGIDTELGQHAAMLETETLNAGSVAADPSSSTVESVHTTEFGDIPYREAAA